MKGSEPLNTISKIGNLTRYAQLASEPAPPGRMRTPQSAGPGNGSDLPGSHRPLLLCFSHLRWDFVWQRPQHLLTRAAASHRVVVFEEAVFEGSAAPVLDLSPRPGGIEVAVPRLAEGCGREDAVAAQRMLLETFLDGAGSGDRTFWYYTPMALAFSGQCDRDLTVYDNMDELSAFRGASPGLVDFERDLLLRAEVVFTGGLSLYEAKRGRHGNVHAFPSSIDVAHFAAARHCRSAAAESDGARRPHLGFFGVIDERLDLDLLAATADLRPDWRFTMVGPVAKIDPNSLPQRANILWAGARAYDALPAELASWDVGLMPFALNEATRFISPTKTPEFLAAGVPVVSTPVADVVRGYGETGLVEIAATAAEVVRAAERLMARPKGPWLAAVDRCLAGGSWDRTWAGMQRLMGEARAVRPVDVPDRRARPGRASDPQPHETMECLGAFSSSAASKRPPAYDWLVVGAGFAGSVLAERLASARGERVLVIDRRPHIGGNAYDRYNEDGLLIHQYGPHIFHTNSTKVVDYLSRFTQWRPYEHRVLAQVDGMLVPVPINLDTVNRLYGLDLTSEQLEGWFKARAEPVREIRTSEDVVVSTVGRDLYEKFFQGYTRKQWGLDPSELDKSVTSRVPTRTSRDDRYFNDSFQAMPARGYTRMFERMLDHPNITVDLGVDYAEVNGLVRCKHTIFTGPIDEFFDHRFGRLPYRSLKFEHQTLDRAHHQPVAVVNYPQSEAYTRVTEYKYLTGQNHPKTAITYEYPTAEGDPYYPVPRPENQALFKRYEALSRATPDVWFVGRLATYRYYNMDQIVGQALATFDRIEAALPQSHDQLVAVARSASVHDLEREVSVGPGL